MNLTLHQCRYIISSYSPLKILEDSDIVIDNGRVVCLGQCYGYRGYDKVDCKEKVVAPAFGNAHIHLYTILKVINEQNPYRALLIAILNMAANGIAAFQSMDENYKTVVEAAKSIGLRVKAGPIIKNKKCDEYISIEKLGYRLYTPIISIENLLEVDEEVLESCIELLLNRNIDIQISVSRTIEETLKFKRIKKLFPVEYLVKKNLLSNKIILTHINWISSWELESIVYYRPRVVVCPYSDALSNINGLPPLKNLLDKEIVIGIGTDNFEYRYSVNMSKDISAIIALYRYSNIYIDVEQAMNIATQGSYNVMNINAGNIEVGKEADIIVFDIRRFKYGTFIKQSLPFLILYEGYIDTTIVNGNIVWSIDELDKYMKIL